MRSREEVLREYIGVYIGSATGAEKDMADRIRELESPPRPEPVVTEAMDRAAWAKIEESCVIEVYDEARVATDVTIVDIHAALRAALTAALRSERGEGNDGR